MFVKHVMYEYIFKTLFSVKFFEFNLKIKIYSDVNNSFTYLNLLFEYKKLYAIFCVFVHFSKRYFIITQTLKFPLIIGMSSINYI